VTGPVPLDWGDVALAAALVLVNGVVSVLLGLRMERTLLVAAARTVVQLALLGFVLAPVFASAHPALVGAVVLVMVGAAAVEASRRSKRRYRGLLPRAFGSIVLGAGATVLVANAGIIGVEPWWTPRYLIPLLGMILGNSLTGVALGVDRVLAELDEGRARVELLLARGATAWEAGLPAAREAVRTGMTPIINSMSVVGLVSIPGMMTGQILGGSDPAMAAKYQILVMFVIASATAIGTTLGVVLTLRAMFDGLGRLRLERLR
jgi:putative ABC transport system permease protein